MLFPTFNEKGIPSQKLMLGVEIEGIVLVDEKKLITLSISHKGLLKIATRNELFKPELVIGGKIEVPSVNYDIDGLIRFLSTASYQVFGSKKALIATLYKKVYKNKVTTFYAIVPKPTDELLPNHVVQEIIKGEKRYYIMYSPLGMFGVINDVEGGKGIIRKINKTYSVWVYK
jgi:hypothetical protein